MPFYWEISHHLNSEWLQVRIISVLMQCQRETVSDNNTVGYTAD